MQFQARIDSGICKADSLTARHFTQSEGNEMPPLCKCKKMRVCEESNWIVCRECLNFFLWEVQIKFGEDNYNGDKNAVN